MAIKVQYGPTEASSAGQILAQAGQANLTRKQQSKESSFAREQQSRLEADRLRQQRNLQQAQIEAQARQQRVAVESAIEKSAMDFRLSRQLQEDAYRRNVESKEQEAKQKAENFEFEYSTKQRIQMAQWTNALSDLPNDASLSNDEREAMAFQLKQRIAGIEKTATLTDTNKPSWAGTPQDTGMTWFGDDGGVYTRNGDGSVRELTEPSKTEKGIERAAEIKQQESDSKFLDSLGSMLVDDPDSRDGGKKPLSDGMVDKMVRARERGKNMMERMKTLREQDNKLREIFDTFSSSNQGQPTTGQAPDDWIRQAQESGLPITEADMDLGPEIGPKQAMLRKLVMDSQQRTLTREEEAQKKALVAELLAISGDENAGSFAVRERPEPSRKRKTIRKRQKNTDAPFGMSPFF